MVSRLRTTRSGASLRTHIRMAVEAVIAVGPGVARRLRNQERARRSRPRMRIEADDGIPEADGKPRRRQAEQDQQHQIAGAKAARREGPRAPGPAASAIETATSAPSTVRRDTDARRDQRLHEPHDSCTGATVRINIDLRGSAMAETARALWYVGPGQRAKSGTKRWGRCRAGTVRVRARSWRDQPRHRIAGRRGARAAVGVPAHARAVHGGRLPVPGEIRLRDGRRVEPWPSGGTHGVRAPSASDRVRRAGRCRRARARERARRARRARRQHGDRAQRGVGCRRQVRRRIAVVGAGVVGALTGFLCRTLAAADVTLVDINPARAAHRRSARPAPSRRPTRRRPSATWSSMRVPAAPGSPPRSASRATKRRSSS